MTAAVAVAEVTLLPSQVDCLLEVVGEHSRGGSECHLHIAAASRSAASNAAITVNSRGGA